MPEPVVVQVMREWKEALLARERQQVQEMARQWLGVERALNAQVEALALEAAELREAGKPLSRAQAFRLERYQELLRQAQAESARYSVYAADVTAAGQREMATLGVDHAGQAITMSFWPGVGVQFARLPVEAVQVMAGMAGDGTPLGRLLMERLAPTFSEAGRLSAWERLTRSLVEGTALGRNPREVARRMRDDLAGGLQRALTIARTEQLRAYRQANVDQYRASGLVEGMKRLTAHDSRVCPACLGDEGRVYPLSAAIPDHPNGRCTGVPIVRGMPEVRWLGGEAWLNGQGEDVQRAILGQERFEAWRGGRVVLGDFVGHRSDPVWGESVHVV